MELSEHARIPMSADQSINLAYVIFARQLILLQDLRAWHKKSAGEKTWPNMKIYLREAQDDLSSLPVAGFIYPNPQQANLTSVTDIITQRLLQEQANLAQYHMQDLYAPPHDSYATPVGTITTSTPPQAPTTPISN